MGVKVLGISIPFLIIVSVLVGIVISEVFDPDNAIIKIIYPDKPQFSEVRSGGYRYINPLLECEYAAGDKILNGLSPLKIAISDYLDTQKNNGNLTDAAVYFRDLNNGPWFGVNQSADFAPASLLKLPVLMAYYKTAEDDPTILKKQVDIKNDSVILKQDFSKPTLHQDKKYTIEELIERMVEDSDNQALVTLEENINENSIDKVTNDLGIETPKQNSPQNFMSVGEYSALFRVLYNSSYLDNEYSEKALALLVKSKFDKGLVAGVPGSVPVAHKYGERELEDAVQLHDCGIVYYPRRPYLLCIMTKGTDYNTLVPFIAHVSKMIYDEVNSRYSS